MVSMEASTIYLTELYNAITNKSDLNHTHNTLTPTLINANSNLNDYIEQGSYYCPQDVVASTILNSPSKKAFHLEIYKHAGVRQVLMTYMIEKVETFERNYYKGNWSNWKQFQYIE